jgi:hypothetical protein
MSWDNGASSDVLTIAAWQYDYGIDPDLTGTVIDFTIYPPPGVWDVSLELIDASGNSRGWFQSMQAHSWTAGSIRPDVAGLQAPFNFFFESPGFDITQVVAIRLDEAGVGGPVFTIPPPPGAPTTLGAWNAWDSLIVRPLVPEPHAVAIWLLLGACFGLVAGWRRRHR